MDADLIQMMRRLAPDLTEEMTRRALILERISALQPVGRRQLAARLNLPEREIRNAAALLRELGYVSLDPSGMNLTPRAGEVLEAAREFSRAMSGLTEMEQRLSQALGIDRVMIAPGNADEDGQVQNDVGRVCAGRLRMLLQSGNTLAVTGGRSIAAVARNLQPQSPLNVMVVPARGGLGRSVELQANTLAEEIAGRLGGHYRLIHLPDRINAQTMQEMRKVPEVSEVLELLERADVILHGIGRAEEAVRNQNLSREVQNRLMSEHAAGESIGSYYDLEGRCLLASASFGVDPARLKPTCRMIAVAAGASKAEAVISVTRHSHHAMLATDEGAAARMLSILKA